MIKKLERHYYRDEFTFFDAGSTANNLFKFWKAT